MFLYLEFLYLILIIHFPLYISLNYQDLLLKNLIHYLMNQFFFLKIYFLICNHLLQFSKLIIIIYSFLILKQDPKIMVQVLINFFII